MPNNTSIVIRQATFLELPRSATCLAKAFHDEALFAYHIHPHRKQYPEDMAYYWLKRFQRDYWDWAQTFLIAVDENTTPHTVCGVAQWHRESATPMLNSLDPRNVLYYIAAAYTSIWSKIWPNRAADPETEDILEKSGGFTEHIFMAPENRERWYLHFLGVEPAYQGQSIGRKLVRWGMEHAEKEGIAAAVVVADGKDRFYQSCGFDTMLGRAGQGEGNPLGVIAGGNIWFKYPQSSNQ